MTPALFGSPLPDFEELRRSLASISCWEDWEQLRPRFFPFEDWPETSEEELEAQLGRDPIAAAGSQWRALARPYAVSGELFQLYERTRWQVFERLEPEAARENEDHPEDFGVACYPCGRYAEDFSGATCPLCGGALVRFPRNG